MTPKEKVQSLLNAINNKHNKNFDNLTDAILYCLDGEIPEVDGVSIDDIVSYFQPQVTDAMSYLNGIPSGYKNYIVITDTHYGDNTRNSAMICRYLWKSKKFNQMLHFGDIITNHTAGQESISMQQLADYSADFAKLKPYTIAVAGNHDETLDVAMLHDSVMDTSKLHYFDGTNTYYWDDTKAKIRWYMCHKNGANGDFKFVAEDVLKNLPTDYSYITCTHIPFPNGVYGGTWNVQGNVEGCAVQKNEMYIGHYTGHEHQDYIDHIVNNHADFHQLTFMADWVNSMNTVGFNDTPVKTEGTSTEQAITIMSINTSTKDVKFYRIGACNSQWKEWNYNYNPTTEWEDKGQPVAIRAFRLLGATNVLEFNSGYAISNYIPCTKDDTVRLVIAEEMKQAINRGYCCCYDSNKNPINQFLSITFPTTGTTEFSSVLRDGTAFIRVSALAEDFERFTITVNGEEPSQPEEPTPTEVTVRFSNGAIALEGFSSTPTIIAN